MKTILKSILAGFILMNLECCKLPEVPGEGEESKDVLAMGTVISLKSEPIYEAEVTVLFEKEKGESPLTGKVTGLTNKKGTFNISVPKSRKYVINVTKTGLGFNSKVFQDDDFLDSIPEETYFLSKATVKTIDPREGGTITVTQTNSSGSLSSRVDWSKSVTTGSLPLVLDDSGRVTSFVMPDKLRQAWNLQASNKVSLSPTSLTIRPNSLLNIQGKPAEGMVSVSVSAVDVFAPGGMPGRNIAMTERGETGPMQSFGAITVEVFDEKQEYNLDPEKGAQIVMPVPNWQREISREFPKTVPILFYNEEEGVWQEDGIASYDEKLGAYVGEVRHFSSINFDIIKTGPSANAAFRFNNSTPPGVNELILPFQVEVTTEDAATNQLFVRTRTIDLVNGGNDILLVGEFGGGTIKQYGVSLNRLPINSPVAVTFFNNSADPVAQAVYVLTTNGGSEDITNDPWGTPDSVEFVNNVYSQSKLITPDLFTDINSGLPGDTLIAMCLNGANTHYRISFASRDLGFDAAAGGGGLALTFNDNSSCATGNIFVTGNPNFSELFKTQTGPPDDPEWMVQVFEVPISAICNDASITSYTITVARQSDPAGYRFTYNTNVGSCVF